jgi:hypothetical protein
MGKKKSKSRSKAPAAKNNKGLIDFPQSLRDEVQKGEFDESRIIGPSQLRDMLQSMPEGASEAFGIPKFELEPHIKPRLKVLDQANMSFQVLNQLYKTSNLENERVYRNLYQDICEYQNVWFDEIFRVDTSRPVHCEQSNGILGTLCTILRQRGDLEGCMEIMPTYTRVLERYQQMSMRPSVDPRQVFCCISLAHKYYLIRINCGIQLQDQQMAASAFRYVVGYERMPSLQLEPNWIYVLEAFNLDLKTSSDATIYNCLVMASDVKPITGSKASKGVQLRSCGHCQRKEEMLGDYKVCSRCNAAWYCSVGCQQKDWKAHKVFCKKKRKDECKVDPEDLKTVATMLTNNYAQTVQTHTGQTVTEKQKKDAIPGLLRLFREILPTKFPQYNDNVGFADGSRDPVFLAELGAYFQKQPGYESQAEISAKPDVQKYVESLDSPDVIHVDDETIEETAEALINGAAIPLAAAMGKTVDKVKLIQRTKTMISTYMLQHPEYNSYRGFKDLSQCEELKQIFAGELADCLNGATMT